MNSSFPQIICIDDNKMILRLYEIMFDKEYSLLTVDDEAKALELINDDTPQLIFLDYSMHHMNGIEVLKKIREKNKKVKIVIVSGDNYKALKNHAIKLGAYDYLEKPIEWSKIKEITKEVIH